MTIMKNLFIMLFLVFASICNAQENESVRKTLEKKYGTGNVEYNSSGWYSIIKESLEGEHLQGACDLQGKEIVPIENCWISKYYDFYHICLNELCLPSQGVIDSKGKYIIPLSDNMYGFEFSKEAIIAIKNGDDDGCNWDFDYHSFKNKKFGLYNKTGKLLLPIGEYSFIKCLNKEKGIYIIGKDGVSGYTRKRDDYPLDAKLALYDVKSETFITEFVYSYIDNILFDKEGLYRFNVDGKIIQYTSLDEAVVEGGKWGYMDNEGKVVIPAKYTYATSFKDGVAQVTENGVTSLIQNPLSGGSTFIRTGESVAVDTQIPETKNRNNETFAFILSNENYNNFSGADYAINDGKIFAEYCKKTLGLPENNVRYYEDATYGNMLKTIKQIKDIADVYDGDAKIIFFFSGLGFANEKDGGKYILPSDASVSALTSTALSLKELLAELNELKTVYTLAFIDAPFNGKDRSGKPMFSGRGVRINNKNNEKVVGNTILVMGNEERNCYSSEKQGHGLLTYSLLSQLKKAQGNNNIQKLLETISTNVKKESLEQFKDIQKPSIKISEQIKNNIQTLKL